MGCPQSKSLTNSPSNQLHKLKIENGYVVSLQDLNLAPLSILSIEDQNLSPLNMVITGGS